MSRKVLILLLLYLWVSSTLTALDPDRAVTQYSVQVWNMEGGLPGNTVYAILQTRDRYLWIGTRDGLVRFDGFNFELYSRGKIPQLKSNVIRALYEDETGTLWIGTEYGGLTHLNHGEFTTFTITEHPALSRISAVNGDRWGNLWIGSFTGGLTCLKDGRFTTYTTARGLPHNQVRSIYKDGNEDLWVTTGGGIVKLLKPGVFQPYTSEEMQSYLKTVCLYKKDTEELWVGTGEKGLFRLKNGITTNYGTKAGVPHPTVTYLYEDRDKNLWIGTDGGGLTRMNPVSGLTINPVSGLTINPVSGLTINPVSGPTISPVSPPTFQTLPGGDGLADGYVYSIYEDMEGSLWVGTLDGGLHQLRAGKFTTYTTREGLVHDYINCIYEGRSGELWFGAKGGLSRLKQGKITTVLTVKNGLLDNSVLSVFEDPAGYLWIATWGGVHRFKNGKPDIITKEDGLSDHRLRCMLRDRHGDTWIGTENGLNRLGNNWAKLTVFTTAQGLCSNFIEHIFEDSKGIIWFCTDDGLNYLKDGVIHTYAMSPGIEDNFFLCAHEDSRGTFWFGSHSGLIRLKGKESDLYNVQSGLIENHVYSILEDESGYLWLGGRGGISRIKKKELENFSAGKIDEIHPDSYNERDGMKSRWCTGSGCITRDGKFWFPTGVGATMIDPNNIKKDDLAPELIIEKLTVDGESFKIKSFLGGPGGRFFKKAPMAAGGTIELAPGKKRFEFYYTAVSFTNPQKIQFKIKLEGYDNDWVNMGNVRNTTYTGLSPGHYTFKVTACNPDGTWNREGVSFSFYLRSHFYETSWFYFLVVLLGILVVFSLHRFRVRQLKARERELRLKEMDKIKSRFFANISHEFRTPLTLIMGPLEERLADCRDKKQERELKMMMRNSRRLLNLINQLLDLSKFESGKMQLHAVRQNIVPFLKGIVNSFDSLAAQNELHLTLLCEEKEIILYYDADKLEKAVLNLLINAVKFTLPGGSIAVTVTVRGKSKAHQSLLGEARNRRGQEGGSPVLEISVKDTGIGIPTGKLDHIFDRFYQAEGLAEHSHRGSGIGLALTRELVELHHGEINVRSEEGKGSEFIISLPLGDSHLKPEEIDEPSEKPHEQNVPRDIPGFSQEEIKEEEDVVETAVTSDPGKKNVILVVEDNADVRSYIRGPLEPLYQVREAKNGEEGIKKAQEIIPDLIISDIMMPGIDGYELCRVLKRDIRTSHIPIILLTAKSSEESIVEGLETGADDYITKPFSTKILRARIKNLIDLRGQLQQKIQSDMLLQPGEISVSSMDETFLKEMQKVIEENLGDPEFGVEQLAKKLYLSQSSLYRKIEALAGQTPKLYIRSYRLKRAAQLLKAKFGNVTEVAFEVGFSSTPYFTRCFKEMFHRLPSDY